MLARRATSASWKTAPATRAQSDRRMQTSRNSFARRLARLSSTTQIYTTHHAQPLGHRFCRHRPYPKLHSSCSPESPQHWSPVFFKSRPCSTARSSSHGQTSCAAGWGCGTSAVEAVMFGLCLTHVYEWRPLQWDVADSREHWNKP